MSPLLSFWIAMMLKFFFKLTSLQTNLLCSWDSSMLRGMLFCFPRSKAGEGVSMFFVSPVKEICKSQFLYTIVLTIYHFIRSKPGRGSALRHPHEHTKHRKFQYVGHSPFPTTSNGALWFVFFFSKLNQVCNVALSLNYFSAGSDGWGYMIQSHLSLKVQKSNHKNGNVLGLGVNAHFPMDMVWKYRCNENIKNALEKSIT